MERGLREPRRINHRKSYRPAVLRLPQENQQIEQRVDFRLCPQVVAGMGPLFPADSNGNDVTAQGEGILVIFVVPHVQDPIAPQAIPLGGQSVSFMGGIIRHQVHYLLAAEHDEHASASPRLRESGGGPPLFGWPGGNARPDEKPLSSTHTPGRDASSRSRTVFQRSTLAVRASRGRRGFRAMIADHALATFTPPSLRENIRPRAAGQDHAGIERRQAPEQISSPGAHAGLVRMLDNGR